MNPEKGKKPEPLVNRANWKGKCIQNNEQGDIEEGARQKDEEEEFKRLVSPFGEKVP